MAFNSTLPPQAYTRDILAAAYTWLQKQPESIRKLATSPDALAGLYLRAQRYGAVNSESEAPVSSQNFMSELKNLATDLRQFEKPEAVEAAPVMSSYSVQPPAGFNSTPSSLHSPRAAQGLSSQSSPQSSGPGASPSYSYSSSFSSAPPSQPPSPPSYAAPQPQAAGGLTPRSREMLGEIREALNLSSDAEAVNLAIGVAYKNLKSLIV